MLTLRTDPAVSATKMQLGECGSTTAAASFDLSMMGLPSLLLDLASLLALLLCSALSPLSVMARQECRVLFTYSDSKKRRGSEDLLIVNVLAPTLPQN